MLTKVLQLLILMLAINYCWILSESVNTLPFLLKSEQLDLLTQYDGRDEFNKDLSKILIPRVVGTDQHKQVANFIVEELENLGWNVERDQFTDMTPIFGKLDFENVIAKLNPNADKFLTLACHYDSKYIPGVEFLGATDSAVPCTMLLHLVKTLKDHLNVLKRNEDMSLMLIFFDGEEAFEEWSATDSLYGSRHLVNKWEQEIFTNKNGNQSQLSRIDQFVLLDLLGAANPTIYCFYKETQDLYFHLSNIENILHDLGILKNHFSPYLKPEFSLFQISDDCVPFAEKGVNILHLIPIPFPTVWHQITDNYEALDQNTIDNLLKIFHAFILNYFYGSIFI